LGLLQGWLDIGAIGHFIAIVLHLGWTNIAGLLFGNLYFYIFNQQRFRAGRAMNSSPAASPARCRQLYDTTTPSNINHLFIDNFLSAICSN
jgi:hypothetical protein